MPESHRDPDVTASQPSRSYNAWDHASGLLELASRALTLKSIPRTGWLDRGVAPEHAESVADHSFGVALLAWACAVQAQQDGAYLDPRRVLTLALIHDLAEADTGDMPPYDLAAVPPATDEDARREFLERRHIRDEARESAKHAAEDAAMQSLVDVLPPGARAAIAEIWDELRQGTTAEARFVKQVDRLETFLQSRRYLAHDPDLPVDSFRREVMETLTDPLLAAVRDAALAEVDWAGDESLREEESMSTEAMPTQVTRQGQMSPEELESFLSRPVICRLGCVMPDGRPYVIPLWFTYADGGFYFVIRERADWVPYVLNDNRVSLCIDSEQLERVLVQGTLEVAEEANVGGRWVPICREMALRYFGDAGLTYFEKSLHEPRWLLFVRPEQMSTWVGGWARRYKHSDW
jgi:putative hydrolase of HD superfamily